jgi:mannose-6-phosphate isomerase
MVWNALLFPAVGHPAQYQDWLWLWSPGEASAAQREAFRTARRFSLADIALLADQQAFLSRRLELRARLTGQPVPQLSAPISESRRPGPVWLDSFLREKVWGSTLTEPWFHSSGRKIGEVWLLHPRHEFLPLLVKFLFTSEKLSVQVHPDDEYAARHENSAGKTEMWVVLQAAPGAAVAVGLREAMSREELRRTVLSGELERWLNWVEVRPGDVIFTPAGTIHAIGAGLVLCEIQQVSDVTYRLYDYGRPRELHLERGLEVSLAELHPGIAARIGGGEKPQKLVECPHFHTDWIPCREKLRYAPAADRREMLIAIEGSGRLNGYPFAAGQAWLVPAGCPPFELEPHWSCGLLRTFIP